MYGKGWRRGLSGIGVLILFIAFILVASLSAVVIIYSSGSLQSSALLKSKEVERGVVTGIDVVSVIGTDGSVGSDIEHFEVLVRAQPGSDPLNLNNTVIILELKDSTQTLTYNESEGNTEKNAATTSDFTVQWVKQGTDYIEGYLARGDLAKIRFNHYSATPSATTGGVGEDKRVKIRIVPRVGSPAYIELITPTPINELREQLWPAESLL